MREHASHTRHGNHLSLLLDSWQARDDRYAVAREQMSPEVEEMVRRQRRKEIDRLPVEDRAQAIHVLNRWSPPRPVRARGPLIPEWHSI